MSSPHNEEPASTPVIQATVPWQSLDQDFRLVRCNLFVNITSHGKPASCVIRYNKRKYTTTRSARKAVKICSALSDICKGNLSTGDNSGVTPARINSIYFADRSRQARFFGPLIPSGALLPGRKVL